MKNVNFKTELFKVSTKDVELKKDWNHHDFNFMQEVIPSLFKNKEIVNETVFTSSSSISGYFIPNLQLTIEDNKVFCIALNKDLDIIILTEDQKENFTFYRVSNNYFINNLKDVSFIDRFIGYIQKNNKELGFNVLYRGEKYFTIEDTEGYRVYIERNQFFMGWDVTISYKPSRKNGSGIHHRGSIPSDFEKIIDQFRKALKDARLYPKDTRQPENFNKGYLI